MARESVPEAIRKEEARNKFLKELEESEYREVGITFGGYEGWTSKHKDTISLLTEDENGNLQPEKKVSLSLIFDDPQIGEIYGGATRRHVNSLRADKVADRVRKIFERDFHIENVEVDVIEK